MRYFIFIFIIIISISCRDLGNVDSQNPATTTDESDLPEWAIDATIYEVNMRQFTEEGTFEAFSTHLDRIHDMGIDIIWLMPIHPISEIKKKEPLGSPYAVANYLEVNPDYGTTDDFDAMVAKIHNLDMHVIIDWVPNHTGWDNPWIEEHPEWYTQDGNGNIIDPIDYNTGESWGWTDVADLNYDNFAMREEMIKSMKYWITERNIDGFRMDVAHGVPDDFWIACNMELKETGEVFLLAEGEVPKQRNSGGFHADYGWTLHHILNEIAKGEKNASEIWEYFEIDKQRFDKGFHMNFTSNHDENSWAGTVFERMGDAHKVMAVLTATFDGMPLVYGGQEEPLRKRLAFFEKDPIGFEDYEYQDFYTELLALKKSNPALKNGEFGAEPKKLLDDENLLVFERTKDGNSVIGLLNLSDEMKTINLPENAKADNLRLSDGIEISGQMVNLEPWGYGVFTD